MAKRKDSKKTRNVEISRSQRKSVTTKTKRDGSTVTKTVEGSQGYIPYAEKTKVKKDKSGNVVKKKSKKISLKKADRKVIRSATKVGRNSNDTLDVYKKGGTAKTNAAEVLRFFRESKMKKFKNSLPKAQFGKPVRTVDHSKYGSYSEVDRFKKDGSSKYKSFQTYAGDDTGTVTKTKYDSDGMEKPGSYKRRDISAKKAKRKIKRVEKKAKRGSK